MAAGAIAVFLNDGNRPSPNVCAPYQPFKMAGNDRDDDLFDAILHLEEKFISDGKEEGEELGKAAGFDEGFAIG